jgi:hypothetical protein
LAESPLKVPASASVIPEPNQVPPAGVATKSNGIAFRFNFF